MPECSPEAVFFRWWELRSLVEAASPQIGRWTGELGIRPSPHCARCGADAVTWRRDPCVPLSSVATDSGSALNGSSGGSAPGAELGGHVLRSQCRRCGAPWLLELVPFVGAPAGSAWSERMSELLALGRVLEALEDPHRRLFLQLYLLERVGDYEAVAAEANRRWPLMHPPVRGTTGPRAREWSRHTARLVVLEARERIVHRMNDAGLWRFA